MASGVHIWRSIASAGRRALVWGPLALLMPAASCVPASVASLPEIALTRAEIQAFTAPSPLAITNGAAPGMAFLSGNEAVVANAALPVSAVPNPTAATYVFTAHAPVDQMRAQDCLAQAIYYEARSEGENGERAVAQVVLNRVRHPAWPNSVCGVVYQGPQRQGGGCQFTFTCDGSLASRPLGYAWSEAQRIAAEALGGRTFAPVGLSTHYHTTAVFPAWAPQLVKTAQIGAHIFYRLPGLAGTPGAFGDAYAGAEPIPHPVTTLFRQAGLAESEAAAIVDPTAQRTRVAAPVIPSDIPQQQRWAPTNLPDSGVREEHSQSGQWRTDAPAAVTGR